MNLATKVKQLRNKLHMSQRDIAKESQLTQLKQATISRVEAGLTQQLKSHAMQRLARALNVTVDHLIGDSDSMIAADILKTDASVNEFVELYHQPDASKRDEVRTYMRFLQSSSQNDTAQN